MRSSLTDAAFNGKIQDLEQLLDAGEDSDANDGIWNPLHAAIENEHSNCVELLLRHGANVERVCAGLTPLAHAVDIAIDGAIQSGCNLDDEPVGIIAQLLAAGASPVSGLEAARQYENEKIVQLLMSAAIISKWGHAIE